MRNQKFWSEEEIEILRKFYPKSGPKNLAKTMNRGWKSIYCKARNLKIKVEEEHKCDRNCNSLDVSMLTGSKTPEGVYTLGFLWADGHLTKRDPNSKSHPGYNINCAFLMSDFSDFKNCLFSAPWREHTKKEQRNSRNNKEQKILYLNDKNLYNYLASKDYLTKSGSAWSKILEDIPEELKHYFWRGLFDGDGCVFSKKSHKAICITSCIDQDWSAAEILCKKMDVDYHIRTQESEHGNCSRFSINRIKSILSFANFIYAGKQFGLQRKKKRFAQIATDAKKHFDWMES